MAPGVLQAERGTLAEWVHLAHQASLVCQEFLECLDLQDLCPKYNPLSIRSRCHKGRTRDPIRSPTCKLRSGQWVPEARLASAVPRVLPAVLGPRVSMDTGARQELRAPRVSEEDRGCLAEMESRVLMDCLEERVQMALLEQEVCLESKECLD